MALANQPETLKSIRLASGLKLHEVTERARQIDPLFPSSHVSLLDIETLGTSDYWKIKALAQIYGRTMPEIAEIARPEKRVAKTYEINDNSLLVL